MRINQTLPLVAALVAITVAACGKETPPPEPTAPGATPAADTDTPADPTPDPRRAELAPRGEITTAGASVEELEAAIAAWKPTLPPDKLELTPAPGVDVMSTDKQNQVLATPNALRFKAADHPDVAEWEKGRVIVSAPADPGSAGKNPFGFARRVERVEQVGDELVVTTVVAALEDIVHGEFQLEFDPETAREVPWEDFTESADWAAENLYVNTLPDLDTYPPGLRDDAPAAATPNPGEPAGDPLIGAISSFAGSVKNTVKSATNSVVNVAKSAGSAIASGAKSAASAIVSGAKVVGGAVATGAQAVGRTIGDAAVGAAQTVVSVSKAAFESAKWLYEKVMPKSFDGEGSLSPEFTFDAINLNILNYNFKKVLGETKALPVEVSFKADSNLRGSLNFVPKLSVGAEVPNPIAIGEKPPLRAWVDVSAVLTASLTLDLLLEAAITSAGGKAGSKLEEALGQFSDFAGPVLNTVRKELLGQEDTKPAGNWKKTVFLSKPKMKVIPLGKFPLVMTATFQIDVDCGFELKATLDAKATLISVHTFTYRGEYVKGIGITKNKPDYNHTPRTEIQVLGGGEASVSCSVIPRVNVFLYDTIGINAGVRGSVILGAKYESTCAANKTKPDGEVSLSLKAGIGIPVGARIQAPGSSWGGKDALDAGSDIGPFEIWNTTFDIIKKSWDVPGLGYCTPTCTNQRKGKDEKESDIDCGGDCPTGCARGKMCAVNSDCASGLFCTGGVCGDSHCGDGVQSGDETSIDCGGATCNPCAVDKVCLKDRDCQSKACRPVRIGFANLNLKFGHCAFDPCIDGKRSPGECAVDCGGACGLCPVGAACADGSQCATGQSNGYNCGNACENLKVDAGETDMDCGGATACDRCGLGKRCNANSDCMRWAPMCTNGFCAAPPAKCGGFGEACCTANACNAGLACNGSACQCPADKGVACGSNCCGAGEMCQNGQCLDPAPTCLAFPTDVRETCAPGQCLATCRAILEAKPGSPSGIYTIQPNAGQAPFAVRCDMSLDGGGWTLVGFEPTGAPANTSKGAHTGALAALFAESGTAEAVAAGTDAGFIGTRFGYAKGHYSHMRLNWCNPAAPKNLYQLFRTSEELFADGVRAANGTIVLSEFQSNDPVLNQQIPTPDGARFCRAKTSNAAPGDTSWGIKGANEKNFACGCNSGGWQGVGSYYGGTGEACTVCDCFGGGWAGTAGNGVQKGGINRNTLHMWIR